MINPINSQAERETAVRLLREIMLGRISDALIEDLVVWSVKGLQRYADGEPLEAALSLTPEGQGKDSARTRAKRELRAEWSRLAVAHCGSVKAATAMVTRFKRTKYKRWRTSGIPENPSLDDAIAFNLLEFGLASERTLRRDNKDGVTGNVVLLSSAK